MKSLQYLLLNFALLGFLILNFISCSEPEPQLPNIIYVLADDMGSGDIEAFNPNCKIKTPHLNQLAADGMRFTDAHSPSAVCTPTRYGIITGRYSWRSNLKRGVLTGKSKALIDNKRTTVASLLKEQGYHTSFIGKWHLGWDWALKDESNFGGEGWNAVDINNLDLTKNITNSPNDLGFDYAYGLSGSLDMAPYVYVENEQITAPPDRITIDTGKYTWWREGPTGSDFNHEDVTPNFFRRAISKIKEQASKQKPFFMYLALPSPHTPILPTEEWLGKSNLNPYADFIMQIDYNIGLMQSALAEAGISENTLFIFTTDNGCSPEADFALLDSLGHQPSGIFRGHKADIYEGGHRVPFIAKWPQKIKAKSVSNTPICHTDLMATVAAITNYNLEDNEGEDSYNLLPLFSLDHKQSFDRDHVIHHSINGSFAVRNGDWKLIVAPGSAGWSFPRPNDKTANENLPPIQLYNLTTDPSEQKNLQHVHPDIVEDLSALLIDVIENGRSTVGAKQSNDVGFNGWKEKDEMMVRLGVRR